MKWLVVLCMVTFLAGCALQPQTQQNAVAAAEKVLTLAKQADGAKKAWTELVYSEETPLNEETKAQANNWAEWFNFAMKGLGFAAQIVLPLL